MPWEETNPMEQRRMFVEAKLTGKWLMIELCERFGISRVTGYKWWDRFKARGFEGLVEESRAPQTCPHKTPEHIERAIVDLRLKYRTWGPVMILGRLAKLQPDWDLPAPSTAGDILSRHGLVKPRKRRHRPRHPGKPYVEMNRPNDVWPADFKGEFKMGNGRYCYPLTVTDGCSRYLLGNKALCSTAHDAAQAEFTRLFREFGLPLQILTDNGTPFASQAICGLSRLSVWWIKLGIHPIRIEPGQPSQNGRHERMHRTLKASATRPPGHDLVEQQVKLDEFTDMYNQIRPHRALDLETPASVYEPSPRPFPDVLPSFEYPAYYRVRKVHGNGCMIWRGEHIFVSHILEDERVGLEAVDDGILSVHLGPVLLARFDEREKRLYK